MLQVLIYSYISSFAITMLNGSTTAYWKTHSVANNDKQKMQI